MADTADTTPVCISRPWNKAIFRPPANGRGPFFFPGSPVSAAPASPHRFAGEAPACTARDRSGSSATGLPVTPPRRWVPGSVLGPLAWASGRNVKGMRRHIGPLHSGYRPPPLAPSRGPLAPARRCSGASARPLCGRLSAGDPGPRLRWPRADAAKPPPVATPPPRPPTAYARGYAPAPVPPGHSVLGLALGRLRVDLAVRPPRLCGLASALLRPVAAGPPRTAPPAPCPPSSLGRLVAWAGYGLRSSRLGPLAARRAAFSGHRPQASGQMPGKGAHLISGWRGPGELYPVSAVSGNSINSYRNFSVGLTILADTADTASACIFRPVGPGRGEDYRVFRLPRSYKLSQPSRCSRS